MVDHTIALEPSSRVSRSRSFGKDAPDLRDFGFLEFGRAFEFSGENAELSACLIILSFGEEPAVRGGAGGQLRVRVMLCIVCVACC